MEKLPRLHKVSPQTKITEKIQDSPKGIKVFPKAQTSIRFMKKFSKFIVIKISQGCTRCDKLSNFHSIKVHHSL